MLQISIFYMFGKHISDLSFFTDTNSTLMWATLIGWGLAQVAYGFLFQTLFNTASIATMVGFSVSIMATFMCTILANCEDLMFT